MTPRFATISDVPAIAALHVQAWEETYPGLVPPSEFARRNLAKRLEIWGAVVASGHPLSYIPDVGFAYMAGQRTADLQAAFPRELWSFYTLKHAHGSGAGLALLKHALGPNPDPFTACVLKGNARATRFYQKIGGQFIREIPDVIDGWPLSDIVYGWPVPIQVQD